MNDYPQGQAVAIQTPLCNDQSQVDKDDSAIEPSNPGNASPSFNRGFVSALERRHFTSNPDSYRGSSLYLPERKPKDPYSIFPYVPHRLCRRHAFLHSLLKRLLNQLLLLSSFFFDAPCGGPVSTDVTPALLPNLIGAGGVTCFGGTGGMEVWGPAGYPPPLDGPCAP
jgi:hypothetical protein